MKCWMKLTNYYNMEVNKANVVIYEIKWLLRLHLDTDVLPTKYLSDFNNCLT